MGVPPSGVCTRSDTGREPMLHVARATGSFCERRRRYLESICRQNIAELAVAEILRIWFAIVASIEPAVIPLVGR